MGLGIARPVAAQSDDPRVTQAREAVEAGRFVDARELLRAALADDPDPAIAFNLALMLRETDRPLEAQITFQRILEEEFGPVPDSRRDRVAELLAEVSAELATIVVSVEGADDAVVEIDGAVVGNAPVEHVANPGRHRVVARADGRTSNRRSVDVARGERTRVALRFATMNEADPQADPSPGGEDLTALWVVLGVTAALLAGGGIALGVWFATRDSTAPQPDPLPDGFLGRVETLTVRF